MGRRTPIVFGLSILTLALLTGCQPPKNRIAEIPPYTGDAPGPMQRLRPAVQTFANSMQDVSPPPSRPTTVTPPPKPAHDVSPPVGSEAGWMPRGGIADKWKYIVIHHSGDDRSTPQSMTDWHVRGRGWDALGYHFVIGNGVGYGDGQVFIGERWPKQMHGAHCKTPGNEYNEHGVGICLIGDLDHHGPSAKQMRSLTRLVSFLSQQCGIPKSHIYTHGGITHKTACPGRFFSIQQVLRQMSGGTVTAGSK